MDNNNKRIIQMLDTIPKFETYSRCSTSLEKVFQDNSFKNLLKSLREQKKPKIYSYFNVEMKKPETNGIFQTFGIDNKKEESKTNLFNEEEDELRKKEKEKEKENTFIKKEPLNILNLKTKKIKYNPQLDPFRYNPNYNSIFKNTPCVRITKPINETARSYKYKNKKNMNLKKQIESPFLTEIGDKAMISSLSTRNKKPRNFFLKNIDNLKKMNNKIKLKIEDNEDRNNHSIRFDKYVDRKEVKNEVNPNVSYIDPYDYHKVKNHSIDFSKMHSRYDTYFLYKNNLKGPSIGYYNPKYDCLDKNMRNISLGNENKKEKNKKYLLRKIWGGYEVRVDYQLIDNSKLGKNNEYNL